MTKFSSMVLSVLVAFYFLTPKAFAEHQTAGKTQNTAEAQSATPAQADEPKRSRFEKHMEKYGEQCIEKLDFGMPNLLMGWTVIISEPVTHYRKTESPWKATLRVFSSLGKGLLLFPVDTVGGALNVATFLVPGKIPLPKNGVNTDQLIGDTGHLRSNECAASENIEHGNDKSNLKV